MAVVGVLLFVLGVALGLHSLALPFGDDQGLYYYVAREWRHGTIPYRDVFDHKPPGIYVVYRVALSLFGESLASPKITELACVLALGALVARLVVPRGKRVPRALYGASATVASIAHYGFFDFWNAYQTELWYTTLGIATIVCAVHVRSLRRASFGVGLFVSLAVLMKPMSVFYSAIGVGALVHRLVFRSHKVGFGLGGRLRGAIREIASSLPWALFGLLLPFALVGIYFGAHGALGPMIDIVVFGNRHYAKTFKNVTTLEAVVRLHRDELEFVSVVGKAVLATTLLRIPLGFVLRDKALVRRGLLGLALVVAASAAVTVQQKFFGVHWVTLVGALAFGLFAFVYDTRRLLERRLGPALATVLPVVVIGAGYLLTPYDIRVLSHEQGAVLDLVTKQTTREQFAGRFYAPPMNYYQVDVDAVSRYLEAHMSADEPLCVRGFDTQIYAQTGFRYGGRFFWTNYIWHPSAYRRDEFVAEDRAYFEKIKPRFVVTEAVNRGRGMLESRETYFPFGYELVYTHGSLDVVERRTTSAPAP